MGCGTTPLKRKKSFGFCLLFIKAKKQLCWCLMEIFKWISILSYDISRRQQCKLEPILMSMWYPLYEDYQAWLLGIDRGCLSWPNVLTAQMVSWTCTAPGPATGHLWSTKDQAAQALGNSVIHRQVCCLKVAYDIGVTLKRLTEPLVIYP